MAAIAPRDASLAALEVPTDELTARSAAAT
jgi:hypothetical protein